MAKPRVCHLCNASLADARKIVSRLGHLGFWEGPAIATPGYSAADNNAADLVSIVCRAETARSLGLLEA